MTKVISNPTVIIKRGTLTPAIEIDLDRITGLYANGGWNQLVQSFTRHSAPDFAIFSA